MRIGTLEIEVRRKGRRRVVRAELTAELPKSPLRIRGSFLRAVERAIELTRRDNRSWAVLQAARGHFELVPLTLAGSDDPPEAEALGRLAIAPGVDHVSITRLTGRLVAIAGERTPFVFDGDVVTLAPRT
jgi:hypothetical protein